MHGFEFIRDLTIVLLVAGAAGWVCQRAGLSAVVGYLAAGILVGPFAPRWGIAVEPGRVEILAQLGLVFLMFSIGLRLSLRKLRRLGFGLIAGVILGAAIIYYLTRIIGVGLGWSSRECLFLAAMLMVSSSAIVGKVLQETGTTHERVGQLALGVSVLEDVLAVVMLTLLSSYVQFGGGARPALGETLGQFSAFVVLAVVAGLLLVPWILRRLSRSVAEELQTVLITAMLCGMAMLAERAGYSVALGAFLLGTIVSETPHRAQVERVFEGMRDVFTAVFFVAIGMQLDLRLLYESRWLILGLTLFTIVGRTFAVMTGLSLAGNTAKDALRVGLSVTAIGEFSFIIAQLDSTGSVIPRSFYPIAVGVSFLTALAAPALTKNSDRISWAILSFRPSWLQIIHAQYYGWLEYLRARQKRNLLWQLSRKRFLQIGVEVLFVTGLLVFSEPLQEMVEAKLGRNWLFPNGPAVIFWCVMTVVVLAPLVAIWRNTSALCLLFAQVITSGNSRAVSVRPVIETVFKGIAAVGIYVWLATISPLTGGGRWLLVASLFVAIVGVALFRRRLVLWHSELEVGLQSALKSGSKISPDTHAPWLRPEGDWEINVVDCVLPDLANCQGRRIADLELRARFGCTIVGIGRQGYLIPLPTPDTVLYPRDKVLLIGTPEQVEAGRKFLTEVSGAPPPMTEFEDVRMESVKVPEGSAAAGKSLKELSPAQNYRIQVAGIHRMGMRMLNPAGDEVIRAGDELLVLGTPEQIRSFKDWICETELPA
jgi:monovalent cation:H+ antiporter-2, CPA2 family